MKQGQVRPMTTETWCCKVIFPNISKKKTLKIRSYRRYGEHGKNMFGFLGIFFMLLYAAELAFSRWSLSTRWSKTVHATIDLRSRHRSNPRRIRFVSGNVGECRWRPRRYQVDPWSRGREVASDVLRSSPKPEKRPIFAIGEGSRFFVACFLQSSAQMYLYQTPGRRPPPIISRFCEHHDQMVDWSPWRARPVQISYAVVGFFDRLSVQDSESRRFEQTFGWVFLTPILAQDSNKHLAEFVSGRSWPKIGPGIIFFGFFWKVKEKIFLIEDLRSQRAVQKSFGGYLWKF